MQKENFCVTIKETPYGSNVMSMYTQLPVYVRKILLALTQEGYEAFLVGGAVRDLLRGVPPQDYDIATGALPEKTAGICRRYGWTAIDGPGASFGCVTAVIDGIPVEITTFRGETCSGAHRPDKIWYARSLREDCSRRDFTVNALALDADGKLYDFYDGLADLRNKLLRPVGRARTRYEEDGLRMLRACRFVGQLGFRYVQDGNVLPPFGEPGTPYYLPHNFFFPTEYCAGLSLARVRSELEKLLLSPCAGHGLMLAMATGLTDARCTSRTGGAAALIPILPELRHLEGLRQNPRFHKYNVWEHTLAAIDNSPSDLAVRWALLLHDIGKGLPEVRLLNREGQPRDPGHEACSARMAADILARLGYGAKFSARVVWLVARHMRFAPMLLTGEKTLLRWLRSEATGGFFHSSQEMTEAFTQLGAVFLADMGATHAAANADLMREGRALSRQATDLAAHRMPVAARDLALSGRELLRLIPQSEMQAAFAYLLERVQAGSLPNETEALLAAVRKRLDKTRPERE